MKVFESLYQTVLRWSKHRHANKYLGAVSFSESSFFPIPPDVMLAPMVIAKPTQAYHLAAIITVASVLGGLLGYLIGAYFFDAFGDAVLAFFNASKK